MIYRILADSVVFIHFCFVLFVIFGGFLVLYRRSFLWLHIPSLVWAILIETFYFICPLTYIENWLRNAAGETGFSGGFVDYYLSMILYINISDATRTILAFFLILINLIVYFYLFKRRRLA